MGKEITIIQSDKYKTVKEVIRHTRYVNGPSGARYTQELKKKVRQDWEKQQDGEMVYVWGYDSTEQHRAERLKESMPEYEHIFPLIDENLSKEEVHGMLQRLKIQRPVMYDMG